MQKTINGLYKILCVAYWEQSGRPCKVVKERANSSFHVTEYDITGSHLFE